MGKKSKTQSEHRKGAKAETNGDTEVANQPSFLAGNAPFDPLLASLFEQSAGPVQAPSVKYTELTSAKPSTKHKGSNVPVEGDSDDESDEENQSGNGSDQEMQDVDQEDESDADSSEVDKARLSRKRKRAAADNLEDVYMQKITREEQKEEAKRKADSSKKRKAAKSDDDSNASQDNDSSDDDSAPPMHESLTGDREATELDKSSRTVFLGNVSNTAIKTGSARKTLLKHLSSFLGSLPKSDTPHKVESIRFRSTAYGTKLGVPRRAAFAQKEVKDSTTSSTNAYVVFSTKLAAQKAPGALNGTVVLDRHLRVDSVAHPSAIDNKRCVFVGNLDFVDLENTANEDGEPAKKKPSTPADIEEGLWRTFNSHTGTGGQKNAGGGNVESVRVVRDQATRVGKGFAYVQFFDPNCVEAALLLDGQKFPPLLPRKLRVVRAKKVNKKRDSERRSGGRAEGARDTLGGRSSKLLGRAGAAKLRESANSKSFIFEGQRAVEGTGQLKVRTKSRGASKGKRSSRRAAAYRAAGGRAALSFCIFFLTRYFAGYAMHRSPLARNRNRLVPPAVSQQHSEPETSSKRSGHESQEFYPSLNEVLETRDLLRRMGPGAYGSTMPNEIVDMIIDEAEYWPSVVTSLNTTPFVIGTDGDKECLRTPPLCFSFEEGRQEKIDENENPQKENTSQILLHRGLYPCRKITFDISAHDQGWGGDGAHRGTFNGSWTWFDAYIIPSNKENTAHGDKKDQESVSTETEEENIHEPAPLIPFLPNSTKLQSNRTATRGSTNYHIVWHYKDSIPQDSPEAERIEAEEGRGSATLDGKSVRSMQVGDQLVVWIRARFAGWRNNVDRMSVRIFWAA
ncbi:Nucleolar protein 12 [Talaromyces islandicus]|uniref:Nucleolar protein 12 n=1 Tax=Talaromyces islandicus TaxID=28573 RepID=A0A0U1MB52_TALIS|nr:Nucleolar protein 12 [Talaromyces islandicus]